MPEQLALNSNWGSQEVKLIPTERYTSREFTKLENERLWPRVWQMTCRLEEIPKVGDYIEYQIADQSFLLVHTPSGSVKAFVNSCLHRGTRLKDGCGEATKLMCRFHGWCWNLDGSFNSMLAPEDFPGLCEDDLQLPECRVGIWGGWVFVNPDLTAEPFEQFIKPIDEQLAPYQIEDMRLLSYYRMAMPANWKAAVEAFEEVYHLPATHPQMGPGVDDVNASYDLLGRHSRMMVPMGVSSPRVKHLYTEQDAVRLFIEEALAADVVGEDQRAALEQLLAMELPEGMTAHELFSNLVKMQFSERLPNMPDDQWFVNWEYTVFPNVVVNCIPGNVVFFRGRPNGDDPDSCIFEIITVRLFPEGDEPPKCTIEWVDDPQTYDQWGLVYSQDTRNMPKVQAGMHSRPFVRLAGYQEQRVANRHRVLDELLAPD
jgi:phenylpropionate dioxygenase-like ring-hydroxylating dioxygenase large terminal subunit